MDSYLQETTAHETVSTDARERLIFAHWLSAIQNEIQDTSISLSELIDPSAEAAEQKRAIVLLKENLDRSTTALQILDSQFPDLALAINSNLGISSSVLESHTPQPEAVLDLPLKAEYQREIREALRFLRTETSSGGWNVEHLTASSRSAALSPRFQEAISKLPADGTVCDVDQNLKDDLGRLAPPPNFNRLDSNANNSLSESEQKILQAIEVSKDEYLNLGLAHNPTINYRVSTGKRGLSILDGHEISEQVYELLVSQGRRMTFLESEDESNITDPTELREPTESIQQGFSDLRLQTGHNAYNLHQRLKHTAREAKVYIEEHGTNALYLSLGMIHWREKGNNQTIRKAPLIMVPATLNRNGPTQRFRLQYSGEEIENNLTLLTKMKEEFGLELPRIPEGESFDPVRYMQKVKTAIDQFKESISGRAPFVQLEANEMHVDLWPMGKNIISRDLDPAIWPEGRKPHQNRVLRGLFGGGFNPENLEHLQTERLDDVVDLRRIMTILDCDSAQMDALLSADKNDLDVEGPPGTGKTQFIVNLIAQCVAQGKSVLFVSEKLDALQVAHRKLSAHGLGPTCLQLHSDKSSKKEAIQQLREPLLLGAPEIEHDPDLIDRIESSLQKLNSFRDAMRTEIGDSDLTPYDAIGSCLRTRQVSGELLDIPLSGYEGWNHHEYAAARLSVQYLQEALDQHGHPALNPFWGSNVSSETLPDQHELQENLSFVQQHAINLERSADRICTALNISPALTLTELRQLGSALEDSLRIPELELFHPHAQTWGTDSATLLSLLQSGEKASRIRSERDSVVKPEAWTADIGDIRQRADQYSGNWYAALQPSYLYNLYALSHLTRGVPPFRPSEQRQLIDDIQCVQQHGKALRENDGLLQESFGAAWQGAGTDWNDVTPKARWLSEFHSKHSDLSSFSSVLEFALQIEEVDNAKESIRDFLDSLESYNNALHSTVDLLQLPESAQEDTFLSTRLHTHAQIFEKWQSRSSDLQSLARQNDCIRACKDRGGAMVLDPLFAQPSLANKVLLSFDHGWYEANVKRSFLEHSEINLFDSSRHNSIRSHYQQDDRKMLKQNIDSLVSKLHDELPSHVTGGRLGYLIKQLQLQRGHDPTRKLLEESGSAVHSLKKVFMMSPYSVAKFLTPGSSNFDVVIVDEGSQLPPLHVLGAAMRGKLLVVCGDRKQLDPPNFFQGKRKAPSDSSSITAEKNNILEFMQESGAQECMLTGHYRSRHQSNIAVSNAEFYDDKLRVFPSPFKRRDGLGLHFNHVPGGLYERGTSRTNKIEAQAVAQAALRHAQQNPGKTLGIAAFSVAQMEAIEDEVEKLSRVHPELAKFMTEHSHEPYFVKNLEHVQGDERDVILVSLGYGFDSPVGTPGRRLDRSFGPVNKDGGEKRLNVLFTRARLSTVVFSNFKAEDLGDTTELSRGVQVLQRFLKFAETGELQVQDDCPQQPPHPLEDYIAEELRRRGYSVEIGVGDKGGRVNIALIDPEDEDHYMGGILLDGPEYQNTRLAREQDRIKDEMLHSLGWNIYRSWSIDWFRDPEKEAQRLVESIRSSGKQNSLISSPVQSYNGVYQPKRSQESELSVQRLNGAPYVQAELNLTQLPPIVSELERTDLSKMILSIVEQEHPVHIDVVRRRIRDLYDRSSLPAQVERRFHASLELEQQSGGLKRNGDFLYSPERNDFTVRDRSNLPAGQKRFHLIPPEEIEGAVQLVIASSYGIREEELPLAVSKALGFQSEAQGADVAVTTALQTAFANQLVRKIGQHLQLTEGMM